MWVLGYLISLLEYHFHILNCQSEHCRDQLSRLRMLPDLLLSGYIRSWVMRICRKKYTHTMTHVIVSNIIYVRGFLFFICYF